MNDDETALTEYLDGRLAPGARAELEARLEREPALARRLKVLRAMKSALAASAPRMPADLKADLLRLARERGEARAPSWLDSLRAAFAAGPWAYGAGAAFAAAGLALAVRLVLPARAPAGPDGVRAPSAGRAPVPAAMIGDPAVADGLRGLWSEDDGGDRDEG